MATVLIALGSNLGDRLCLGNSFGDVCVLGSICPHAHIGTGSYDNGIITFGGEEDKGGTTGCQWVNKQ